jgi:two-component system sensor histidine kinase PilS (NtrC family)
MSLLIHQESSEDHQNASVLIYKIKWLMIFRVLLVTILLGSALIIQLRVTKTRPLDLLYILIIASYVFTAITIHFLPRISHLTLYAYVQIIYDIFLETGIVYVTGGIESVFTFTYIFTIISASILLFRRGAFLAASLSTILYGILIDLQFYRILPLYGSSSLLFATIHSSTVYYNIFLNSCAFYLIAFLSSYLSESLRRTHQRLQETSHDLTELQTFHQNILQSMHSGLLTTDLHGKITLYNSAAERITRYNLSDVYGVDLQKIFPDLDADYLIQALSRATIPAHRLETTIHTKSAQEPIYLGLSVSLLQDNRQKPFGLIFIFQDLTELKAMQEQVARADRLAAIGQLAAGVAHEIRNPLASISGSIQMLSSTELALTEENRALMNIILRESKRLDAILTDFLLYARPKNITFVKCDIIHEVIFSTIGLLTQDPRFSSKDIQIKMDVVPNFPKIVCDVQQIQQVFWNLFLNAFQAMETNGTLFIEACVKKLAPWELETQIPIYAASITIRDTGCGIPEDVLHHIFHPFYTTKNGGTGLGLAIVHSIIENHHGTIHAQSSETQGTTFTIVLPLTQEHWS